MPSMGTEDSVAKIGDGLRCQILERLIVGHDRLGDTVAQRFQKLRSFSRRAKSTSKDAPAHVDILERRQIEQPEFSDNLELRHGNLASTGGRTSAMAALGSLAP